MPDRPSMIVVWIMDGTWWSKTMKSAHVGYKATTRLKARTKHPKYFRASSRLHGTALEGTYFIFLFIHQILSAYILQNVDRITSPE